MKYSTQLSKTYIKKSSRPRNNIPNSSKISKIDGKKKEKNKKNKEKNKGKNYKNLWINKEKRKENGESVKNNLKDFEKKKKENGVNCSSLSKKCKEILKD